MLLVNLTSLYFRLMICPVPCVYAPAWQCVPGDPKLPEPHVHSIPADYNQ